IPNSVRDCRGNHSACRYRQKSRYRAWLPAGGRGCHRRAVGCPCGIAPAGRGIARAPRHSRGGRLAETAVHARDHACGYLLHRRGNTMRGERLPCAMLLVALLLILPARAADLFSGLSTDLIQITSSFTGTDFVVFGATDPPPSNGMSMRD